MPAAARRGGGGAEVVGDDLTSTMDDVFTTEEFVFKVVVVGAFSVGKSLLIHHLCRVAPHLSSEAEGRAEEVPSSPPLLRPTVGVEFRSCEVSGLMPHVLVRLQLWDTAGLEQYAAVPSTTFRDASLVLCVYDVTRLESLKSVPTRFMPEIVSGLPGAEPEQIFVVGNKVDLREPAEGRADDEKNAQRNRERDRRRQQHIAEHPSEAFDMEEDEEDEEDEDMEEGGERTVHRDPMTGAGMPAQGLVGSVSPSHVKADVLDPFPNIHHAEVSAKTGEGVSSLLRRICWTLLQREGAMGLEEEEEDDDVASDGAKGRYPAGAGRRGGAKEGEGSSLERGAGPIAPASSSSPTPTKSSATPIRETAADAPLAAANNRKEGERSPLPKKKTSVKAAAKAANTKSQSEPQRGASGGGWSDSGMMDFGMAGEASMDRLHLDFSPAEGILPEPEEEKEGLRPAAHRKEENDDDAEDFYADLLSDTPAAGGDGDAMADRVRLLLSKDGRAGGATASRRGDEKASCSREDAEQEGDNLSPEEAATNFKDDIHRRYEEIEQQEAARREQEREERELRKKNGEKPQEPAKKNGVDIAAKYKEERKKQQKKDKSSCCCC